MNKNLQIALAQINPTVGNLQGNLEQIVEHSTRARDELGCDLVVFPELCITGYPPEDLLLRDDFLSQSDETVRALVARVTGIAAIIGHPVKTQQGLFNALSVIDGGELVAQYHKRHLPNYTVFDEKRYFTAGTEACVIDFRGHKLGLTVCEDIWQPGPVEDSAALGADLLISINASPFHNQQSYIREEQIVCKHAKDSSIPIVYVNQMSGQDELVFDGSSIVVNADGEVACRLPAFETAMTPVCFDGRRFDTAEIAPRLHGSELVYKAVVTGVRDYIEKNGFRGIVLGLSGGIDSAISLTIAVDAIGKDRVAAIMMPSRYTSDMSLEDAKAEAEALGVRYEIIPIGPIFDAAVQQLAPMFEGLPADTTEENIQARSRGMLLMAVSNKLGYMVLTTGNKSEMAVGYATLYGDMVGGFSAIKDVPKTMVYELARYRNTLGEVIPERVITRPPSAELAPDQIDEDSLPPYDVLDPILEAFVEQDKSAEEIIEMGFDPETVHRIIRMVVRNEYKRRQSAPGVRITSRAFGRDRRYPITSGFF
ncbi:MAG: NAD+ synthase [Pseudomonadota bacterium]